MRRIERLINLTAALLDSPRPMPIEEIRTRIAGYDQPGAEAFRRAFERDKESLRSMGIPVELVTDPLTDQAAGYTIPKERYYLPQLDLEPDEVAALRLAADAILGGGEEAAAGLLKLAVDSPLDPLGGPRVVWGADVAIEQPLVSELYAALQARRPVGFEYASATGATTQRRVEPYALLHRRGQWYVVGRDLDRDALRSFKVSRMSSPLDLLEGTYHVPASFDASAHLSSEPWERGPDEPAATTVRFSPALRWWAEQNLAEWPSTRGPGGTLDVRLEVGRVEALVSWMIERGSEVEIVAPEGARAALLEHLAPYLEDAR